MSARNWGPPVPARDGPHGGLPQPPVLEPHFARGHGGVPHPALLYEMREAHYSLSGSGQLPTHPAIIQEQLAAQHDDIQGLLVDNQGLAATHVALRQELEVAQYELQRTDKYAHTLHAEKESQLKELHEKSVKMENELQALHAMKSELVQVHMDIKELTAARQDLTAQVQMMTHDLGRITSDVQQIPVVKAEIEHLRHELERAKAAVEHEKNGFAESLDHGKVMENKLISMARELEKLRAELSNAEKRAHAAAAVGNPAAAGYNANHGNAEQAYLGNQYAVGYGMMPANSMHPAPAGAEGYPHYGHESGVWGSYHTQQAQGPR